MIFVTNSNQVIHYIWEQKLCSRFQSKFKSFDPLKQTVISVATFCIALFTTTAAVLGDCELHFHFWEGGILSERDFFPLQNMLKWFIWRTVISKLTGSNPLPVTSCYQMPSAKYKHVYTNISTLLDWKGPTIGFDISQPKARQRHGTDEKDGRQINERLVLDRLDKVEVVV